MLYSSYFLSTVNRYLNLETFKFLSSAIHEYKILKYFIFMYGGRAPTGKLCNKVFIYVCILQLKNSWSAKLMLRAHN